MISSRLKNANIQLLFEMLTGLALRSGGAVASFALTFLVARQFGADAVGLYQIGLTTATLAALAASLGLPLVLVREAGKLMTSNSYGDLAATFRACRKFILRAAVAIIAGIVMTAWVLGETLLAGSEAITFVYAFVPLVLMLSWLRLNNDLLRSLGDVWKSQSLEGIFYSSLTALVIGGLWLTGSTVEPIVIPVIYVAMVALALFLSVRIIATKKASWGDGEAQLGPADGIVAAIPSFLMLAGDWLILLFVGIFLSISDAGIYRTVVMYCIIIQMVTTSFAVMAGPHLARARARSDRAEFFKVIRSAGLLGLLIASPVVLIALFFPEFVLGLFGPEFVRGSQALGILALAQLAAVVVGPVAPAMVMLHREKQVFKIEASTTTASIVLSFVLVLKLGLIGPPIAILVGSVLRSVVTRYALVRAWPAD